MNIDEIAEKIIFSFNADDTLMLEKYTKNMLRQIKTNESMFSVVQRPYLVAKSLYFMLTEDYLTEDEQISVVKLVYFCLLINYLKNKDCRLGSTGHEDLISGCQLALVIISMQNQYLKYSIISGLARYINPEIHIRNQILLFGGIVKEAEIAHCNFPQEDIINDYFVDTFKEIYRHLPTGRDLAVLNENCNPVIKNIKNSISINLKESWLDDF